MTLRETSRRNSAAADAVRDLAAHRCGAVAMTPEQAYDRARFMLPGVRIIVGPTDAREERVRPVNPMDLRGLPGDYSWREHLLRERLGYLPSAWAQDFAARAEILGHTVTDAEWLWLHRKDGRGASLKAATDWISEIKESAKEKKAGQ